MGIFPQSCLAAARSAAPAASLALGGLVAGLVVLALLVRPVRERRAVARGPSHVRLSRACAWRSVDVASRSSLLLPARREARQYRLTQGRLAPRLGTQLWLWGQPGAARTGPSIYPGFVFQLPPHDPVPHTRTYEAILLCGALRGARPRSAPRPSLGSPRRQMRRSSPWMRTDQSKVLCTQDYYVARGQTTHTGACAAPGAG